MSAIFIIGAGTFFGQQLCQQFAAAGWKVFGSSRRGIPPALSPLPIHWVPVRFTSLSDPSLRPALKTLAEAEVVVYAGGFQDRTASHAELYEEHVLRTAVILHFCRYLPRLRHYYHCSTLRVAGRHVGPFHEASEISEHSHADAWAGVLYAAEKLVLHADTRYARSIMRLGEVIGSSSTGEFPRISGMYHILQALYRLKHSRFPFRSMTFLPFAFSESTRLPLLPVDMAAQAAQQLILLSYQHPGAIYHILGGKKGISARKVLAEMMAFVGLDMEPLALPYDRIPKSVWKYFHMPADVLATLNCPTQFESSQLEERLPALHFPHYKDYAATLFRYADQHIFKGGAL